MRKPVLLLLHRIGLLIIMLATPWQVFASVGGQVAPTDSSDVRTITADRGLTPTHCIGQPTTPLCAVATAAACDVWSDTRLCHAVGYQPVYPLSSQEDYWRLYVFHYKEMAEHVLTRADIPAWASNLGVASWHQGDLATDVWFQVCRPENDCLIATDRDPRGANVKGCAADRCEWEVGPRTYILRPSKGGWRVVYVYIPQWHQRDDPWKPSWQQSLSTE